MPHLRMTRLLAVFTLSIPVRALAPCAFMLLAGVGSAKEYYVSPSGSDEAAGTHEAPWQTIRKANREVKQGDTVFLFGGTYRGEIINPKHSGTGGRWIVYAAYEDAEVVLTDIRTAIALQGRSYIKIDGITVDGQGSYGNESVKNCVDARDFHHIAFNGFACLNVHGVYGMRFQRGEQLALSEILVDRVGSNNIKWHGKRWVVGDGLALHCVNRSVLTKSRILRAGHTGFDLSGGDNEITHNYFENMWPDGHGYRAVTITANVRDLEDCQRREGRNLFEYNVCTKAKNSFDARDNACMKVEGKGQIVRYNLFYDNEDWALSSKFRSKKMQAACDNRIYNNTVYDSGGIFDAGDYGDDGCAGASEVINNLVTAVDDDAKVVKLNFKAGGREPTGDIRFVSNALGTGKIKVKGLSGKDLDWFETNTRAFSDNIEAADPEFVSVDPTDPEFLTLAPGSPFIDAGQALSFAVSDGEGNSVKVDDADFFWRGDEVRVGTQTATVLESDYAQDMLILDTEIEWKQDAPVTLSYSGEAPDLGAFEAELE
jgi:hypothetical protein